MQEDSKSTFVLNLVLLFAKLRRLYFVTTTDLTDDGTERHMAVR